ncbi:tRNA (Ile)-lysidine synthase [Quillaja saponaria]|uniref:tRNA (Ile)-lysidine synthase n=1 Tax=Quillaja saponaria TaxID=32244 RepID=A0AAD7LDW0_QUISA|nr:tRNA (Ile)-lysidine synthase [Quillaja saponaria]
MGITVNPQKMVAISLYRGNLHRVPDVSRRWIMPNPKISLKDFKSLLIRRSKALSRLRSTTTSSNPDDHNQQNEAPKDNRVDNGEGSSGKDEIHEELEGGGSSSKKPVDGSDVLVGSKPDMSQKDSNPVDGGLISMEKPAELINPDVEMNNKVDILNEKEKRKMEVEDKLQVLNAKKHNLVLVLKQILNAEEELKRRSSMQGISNRPSVPLQADGTNDNGSLIRPIASRMSVDTNLGGDMEGGEAEDLANHNIFRNMLRTSSMSPSSESPFRRTPNIQQNMVSHPSRASLVTSGSPSRFAPMGHQGNPANLPTVSVSGTSYIASSPSPAASGGTSVFRDARHPSPWN